MDELIIRIKSSDFSEFAGYYHTDESYTKNNEVLNKYIRLYKTNDDIRYLQIECDRHFSIDTIAYICNRVDEKYFIKTDFADKNKENKYWLCFHKLILRKFINYFCVKVYRVTVIHVKCKFLTIAHKTH